MTEHAKRYDVETRGGADGLNGEPDDSAFGRTGPAYDEEADEYQPKECEGVTGDGLISDRDLQAVLDRIPAKAKRKPQPPADKPKPVRPAGKGKGGGSKGRKLKPRVRWDAELWDRIHGYQFHGHFAVLSNAWLDHFTGANELRVLALLLKRYQFMRKRKPQELARHNGLLLCTVGWLRKKAGLSEKAQNKVLKGLAAGGAVEVLYPDKRVRWILLNIPRLLALHEDRYYGERHPGRLE